MHNRIKSFRYAFEGCWYVIRTQKNAWIHAFITMAVIVVGFWLELTRGDWVLLVLAIGLVWITEMLNTAIEAVVDLTVRDSQPLAKIAKDVSAGAVLLSATTAVIIGLLIFGPPLWANLTG